ncbi:glutathione S-transferase kappa 1-like [Tubulanus polymorphus]|uniref:glutathione S-transferase kappa 1-like n=1 Tax=Tubulanus polymorphus TaxID=672921 RepID=UPI003DA1D482
MAAPISKKSVELFYDVVSPYSWIGFEVLCRYRQVWKSMDLKLKPFFLGGVMKGSENQPPGFNMSKFVYMGNDIQHLRKHFQIPLEFPKDPVEVMFKRGSLSAMRFITAVDMKNPEFTEEISRQMWLRIWNRDEDITKEESFIAAAKEAGLSEHVINDAITNFKSQPVKDRLKEYTEEALGYGAFGAPTIVAKVEDGETHMIFGSDRFHVLGDLLGELYSGPQVQHSKL